MASNVKGLPGNFEGLDEFTRSFLFGDKAEDNPLGEEYTHIAGQKASDAAIARYQEERTANFIKQAGSFAEDLIAFLVEQKKLRHLDATTTVFGLALVAINLRHHYAGLSPEELKNTKEREQRLEDFDHICQGAQIFYDNNT